MAAQNEKRTVEFIINGKSAEVSLNQVRKEVLALTREFGKLKEADDPKVYKQKAMELTKLSNVYKEMKTNITGAKTETAKFWDSFKMIAAGAVGGNIITTLFYKLTGAVSGSVEAVKELSDEMTNIEKTTNLSAEAVAQLDKELGKIDTRTSKKDLREFAVEAGKLGKTSVEDVAKFVAEADKINVALGEDIGKDAIIEIQRLAGIFGDNALDIGSAINSIGQASVATEIYQVEFLKRTAAIGKAAKISSNDLLGYGAALEIAGQTNEVSGTALNMFLIDFIKNAEKFGAVAGYAKGEMKKLMDEKGTNAAFLDFLTKLKEGSKGTEDILKKLEDVGVDGARGSAVLLSLSQNVGSIIEQQRVAAESTGSIMTEFEKRNNNAAAKYEKALKKIEAVLMPIMQSLGNFFIGILDGIVSLINPIITFTKVLVLGTVAWGTYRIVVLASGLATKLTTAALKENAVIIALQRMATIAGAAAQALFTGNLTRATAAMRLFNMTAKMNPLGMVLTAITLVTTAMSLFGKEAEATEKALSGIARATDETALAYGKERQKVEGLLTVARSATSTKEEQKKAIDALNKISPEYLGNIDAETVKTNAAKEAIDRYLVSFQDKTMAQALEKSYSTAIETQVQAELDFQKLHTKVQNEVAEKFKDQTVKSAEFYIFQREHMARVSVAAAKKEVKDIEDLAKSKKIVLGGGTLTSEITGETYTTSAEMKAAENAKKKAERAKNKNSRDQNKDAEKDKRDEKAQKEALEREYDLAIEYSNNYFKKKEAAATYARAAQLINEKEYQQILYDIEDERLADSLRLHEEYGKDMAQVSYDMAKNQLAATERAEKEKADFSLVQPIGTFGNKYKKYDKDGSEKEGKKRNPKQLDQGIDKANAAVSLAQAGADLMQTIHDIQIQNLQNELDVFEKTQQGKRNALDAQLEAGLISQDKYNASIAGMDAELVAKQKALKEAAWKKKHKEDIANSILEGIMAVTKVLSSYAGIFPANLVMAGLMAGVMGAQTAAIANQPMPQFYEGGNTWVTGASDGRKYFAKRTRSISGGGRFGSPTVGLIGERGPELVIPNYLYANPRYANVMGALEAAISTRQFVGGGVTATSSPTGGGTDSTDISGLIAMNTMVMQSLMKRLDSPIEAKVYWSRQRYDEYVELEDKAKSLGTF